MKSHRMSIGKIFLYSLYVLFLSHCSAFKHKNTSTLDQKGEGTEVSVKEDKAALEELRKNIPPDVREHNDTLKIILSMMGELKTHPQKVREKFNHFQRQRRTKFQKEHNKIRKNFSRNEKQLRDSFLKDIKKKRDEGKAQNMERDQRNEFYAKLEYQRKNYFDEQRDKRKDFESEMQQKSRDFYSELNEQQKEFNEEWRIYNKRWQDWQKSKDIKKKESRELRESSSQNRYLSPQEEQDFKYLQNSSGQKLSTEDK
ncbi:MAG: hypothetical protein H6625_01735 [Bdellovibrionaceae bacterium]|nr:hypothetical protein [Pseudobdellovibrionaceae bacterium]